VIEASAVGQRRGPAQAIRGLRCTKIFNVFSSLNAR